MNARIGFGGGALVAVLAGFAIGSIGCSSADAAPIDGPPTSLARVMPESAGSHCATGGQAIVSGIDANGNGELDADEVKDTSFVCNGASPAVPKLEEIPAGDPRCPSGGTAITVVGASGQVESERVVCNGATGATGAEGPKGDQGDAGLQGPQGDAGAPAPEPVFGQFLPSQIAKGAVVTCATVSSTSTTATCNTMKVNGLDVRLAPGEANAICSAITGKGYATASGMGAVSGSYMTWTNAWSIASGSTAPMQNLTCNK